MRLTAEARPEGWEESSRFAAPERFPETATKAAAVSQITCPEQKEHQFPPAPQQKDTTVEETIRTGPAAASSFSFLPLICAEPVLH